MDEAAVERRKAHEQRKQEEERGQEEASKQRAIIEAAANATKEAQDVLEIEAEEAKLAGQIRRISHILDRTHHLDRDRTGTCGRQVLGSQVPTWLKAN